MLCCCDLFLAHNFVLRFDCGHNSISKQLKKQVAELERDVSYERSAAARAGERAQAAERLIEQLTTQVSELRRGSTQVEITLSCSPSLCLLVCLSICLSVCLSVCLSAI